jgi:subtilisin family serine protease
MTLEDDQSSHALGRFISLGGKHRELIHHPTDFTVLAEPWAVRAKIASSGADISQLATGVSRVKAESPEAREKLMDDVRAKEADATYPNLVAHHIYQLEDSGEEIVIADRIYLTLEDDTPDKLGAILEQFGLIEVKRIGRTHVLTVTDRAGRNPLKVANEIAGMAGVECCQPKMMPRVTKNNTPVTPIPDLQTLRNRFELFDQQWHLTTNFIPIDQDVSPTASINAHEAWTTVGGFGSPDIIVAIIDDGFDLARPTPFPLNNHPAFLNKVIDPNRKNFSPENTQDVEPISREHDIHGTPVASLAIASVRGDGILGVAPGCSFLPLRFSIRANIDLEIVLEALEIASQFAHVVNCSFSLSPSSIDYLGETCWFIERVKEMTNTGGKNGKGLVIVFAAGNDDAPIHLPAAKNTNGVRFVQHTTSGEGRLVEIKPQSEVHCGFAEIPGVVVVGAMTSLKRKSGYSNWGPELTVSAPSDNHHLIARLPNKEDRKGFEAPNGYPGRGLVTAVNRSSLLCGDAFEPLPVNAATAVDDTFYTQTFGGTSGAAPLVTGVVALMLSVKPDLKATEVIEILKKTADKDLEMTLDLPDDPNLKTVSGQFFDGQSMFFGAGKVDAAAAVERALELRSFRARATVIAARTLGILKSVWMSVEPIVSNSARSLKALRFRN